MFPEFFGQDPAMLGRRIENQPRFVAPPSPPRPVQPMVTRQPRLQPQPRPTFRPIQVPSPEELGIELETTTAAFQIPPPEQLGVELD